MRSINKPQKILLSGVIFVLLLTTIILIFFLLRNNAPSYSARLWFEAISNADETSALELTCNIRINEVKKMIEDNLNDNIQEVDITNLEFTSNIVKIRQQAIVEAKGIFTGKIDNEIKDVDIHFFWRFNYEDGKWKWCGTEGSERPNTTLVIASISALFFIIFISFIFSPEKTSTDEEDITQFIEPISSDEFNEESILRQLDSYDTGEVKSINKRTGVGIIETDEGDKYIMNIGEVIGKGGQSINVGEDVLFQKKLNAKERKVKNIIRVEENPEKIGQYSKWLRKLAYDTKRLRKNLNSYNNDYIEKKLNDCNAYSELLNDYATRNGVKLKLHEVVLSNVIKRDLKNISRVMEENSKKVPWWAGLLSYVLKIISIVADFIQIASPSTGELLRLVGKSIGKLLDSPKQPPQIGPGDE